MNKQTKWKIIAATAATSTMLTIVPTVASAQDDTEKEETSTSSSAAPSSTEKKDDKSEEGKEDPAKELDKKIEEEFESNQADLEKDPAAAALESGGAGLGEKSAAANVIGTDSDDQSVKEFDPGDKKAPVNVKFVLEGKGKSNIPVKLIDNDVIFSCLKSSISYEITTA